MSEFHSFDPAQFQPSKKEQSACMKQRETTYQLESIFTDCTKLLQFLITTYGPLAERIISNSKTAQEANELIFISNYKTLISSIRETLSNIKNTLSTNQKAILPAMTITIHPLSFTSEKKKDELLAEIQKDKIIFSLHSKMLWQNSLSKIYRQLHRSNNRAPSRSPNK